MDLKTLLEQIELVEPVAPSAEQISIQGLHYDSRRIQPGQAFVAIRGEVADGNDFVGAAVKNGAIAVLSEQPAPPGLDGVCWVRVAQARRALATASANWFGRPAGRLKLVGITGTNGKTTTAFLTESLLRAAGWRTGLIGTVEYHVGGEVIASPHTTPESYDLQALFARMVAAGCTAAVMEVSSHALAMDRVWGCHFDVAVFSNLTQDHLDFHRTMAAYRDAKRRLFEGTGAGAPNAAVVNADDPAGEEMVAGFAGRRLWYSARAEAVRSRRNDELLLAGDLRMLPTGVRFQLQGPDWQAPLESSLLARVNVYNLLAAIGTVLALGVDREKVLAEVPRLPRVRGRFERVYAGQPFTVVVDYAHTPDALVNVLELAREMVSGSEALAGTESTDAVRNPGGLRPRIITVFGCGGDRDRGKRPLMGEAAARLSDLVVVTSDNPRSEDPRLIMNDILVGLQRTSTPRLVEPDRRMAIALAMHEARPGDVVVLAGKGHEDYQIIGTEKQHFDDREEALKALQELGYVL